MTGDDLLAALSLVRQGEVIDLSQSLYNGMPVLPFHVPFHLSLHRRHGDTIRAGKASFANEIMVTSGHTSTHLDALGHFSQDGEAHGGRSVGEIQCHEGMTALGIEETPPIFRRGLLLDVAGAQGVPHLSEGHAIDAAQLQAAAEKAGVTPRKGDIVLIRTGWIQMWDEADRFHGRHGGCPGVSPNGAEWLIEHGCYMVGADTAAFEVYPQQDQSVHAMLLVHAGIQIIENLNLEDLAAKGIAEFLFVSLPLKIVGATGSPIRPVALY